MQGKNFYSETKISGKKTTFESHLDFIVNFKSDGYKLDKEGKMTSKRHMFSLTFIKNCISKCSLVKTNKTQKITVSDLKGIKILNFQQPFCYLPQRKNDDCE